MRSMPLDYAVPAVAPSFMMSGYISRAKAIVMLHVAFIVIVAGAGLLFPVMQLDGDRLVYPASVLAVGAFVWILWSWYALRKTLFEPYALFMIAAGSFNGGRRCWNSSA